MNDNLFKFRQFPLDLILQSVRWYLRYHLSYRNLEEMLVERGMDVDHSTIYRWVQRYAPELDERTRPYFKPCNDYWRLDETIIKVKGKLRYLWRVVDSEGNTIDFVLTARRDTRAAKRFLRKALQQVHAQTPRILNTDRYVVYPKACRELKASNELPETTQHRQVRYLNNIIEQDHRFIKRKVKAKMNFKNFWSAQRTIRGYETMNQIRKGQVQGIEKGDITGQICFINQIFGLSV